MNDDLYSYLDLSGPEYAYLGHFRDMEYICNGHNTGASAVDITNEISAGNIPNLKTGGNYAADQEPSDISKESTAGATPPSSGGTGARSGGSSGGVGSRLASAAIGSVSDLASGNGAQDFSSDEGTTTNVGATIGDNLKKAFGIEG